MSVFIELGENRYILTGDIDSIKNKRRAKSNFESCVASFDKNNQIITIFWII